MDKKEFIDEYNNLWGTLSFAIADHDLSADNLRTIMKSLQQRIDRMIARLQED